MNTNPHQYPDLFPATLLVAVKDGHAITNALNVSKHFHRKHKNILRDIEKLIKARAEAGLDRLKFEPIYYTDSMNRQQMTYEMDRKACTIFLMGLGGKQAAIWREDFYNAFESMERHLAQMTSRFATVVDVVCPSLRPTVEGTEAGLNRAAIAQRLGKSCASVTYHRGRARQFGLLTPKGGKA